MRKGFSLYIYFSLKYIYKDGWLFYKNLSMSDNTNDSFVKMIGRF